MKLINGKKIADEVYEKFLKDVKSVDDVEREKEKARVYLDWENERDPEDPADEFVWVDEIDWTDEEKITPTKFLNSNNSKSVYWKEIFGFEGTVNVFDVKEVSETVSTSISSLSNKFKEMRTNDTNEIEKMQKEREELEKSSNSNIGFSDL